MNEPNEATANASSAPPTTTEISSDVDARGRQKLMIKQEAFGLASLAELGIRDDDTITLDVQPDERSVDPAPRVFIDAKIARAIQLFFIRKFPQLGAVAVMQENETLREALRNAALPPEATLRAINGAREVLATISTEVTALRCELETLPVRIARGDDLTDQQREPAIRRAISELERVMKPLAELIAATMNT